MPKAEIKNLKKAAKRIKKAIKQEEEIVVFADSDLDGVAALIILKEAIESLKGKVRAIYFPDREKEGYGITKSGLSFLKKKNPDLLITVDFGITSFKEVKEVKRLGIEVIILDHHEILDKLPAADIIVDPKQKGDKYPFKNLAAAGIVFKLAELLLEKDFKKKTRQRLVELAAIATIADMMPQEADNKEMIEEGLLTVEKSSRFGLNAFFKEKVIKDGADLRQRVSQVNSLLNVRDIREGLPASYRLLVEPSLKEAKEIIKVLVKKGQRRKQVVEKLVREVEKMVKKKEEPIIFEGGPEFEYILISKVASILVKKYKKPVFIYKKMAKESQGTVRGPKDVDLVSLMKKCKSYPLTFGGHPQAAGFRIKNSNLLKFKKCLIKNV